MHSMHKQRTHIHTHAHTRTRAHTYTLTYKPTRSCCEGSSIMALARLRARDAYTSSTRAWKNTMTAATETEATRMRPPSTTAGPTLDFLWAFSASSQAAAPSVGSHSRVTRMLCTRHERQLQGPNCTGPRMPLSSRAPEGTERSWGIRGASCAACMSVFPTNACA